MRAELVGGVGCSSGAGARPNRRAFLRVGAGCAMPLLAGGVLAPRGASATERAAAPGQPAGQDGVEPILAYVEQELVRTYHAMRGPLGVRGEHVRSVAAQVDLVGICLESNRSAPRAEAAIRQRLTEHGRDATTRDGLEAYERLLDDLSQQHGIIGARRPEAARLADALDRIEAGGLRLQLRGHRARLHRLASELDRAGRPTQDAKATPMPVRQKPGDDLMGYPEIQPGPGMTMCEFLAWLEAYFELVAVTMALGGVEVPAGIIALLAIITNVIQILSCRKDAEV